MISVVILTRNEKINLPVCLESVSWCDDIVVVDSGSTDQTVEIARGRGARVLVRDFDTFADQRNYAMEAGGLRHPWVFHLDADERIPDALKQELVGIASGQAAIELYAVASRLMWDGIWLKRAGLFPSYQVRFGKIGALEFVQVGHGQREKPGHPVGFLKGALLHYPFAKGMEDWVQRHHRYAADEARKRFDLDRGGIDWAGLVDRGSPIRRRRALKEISWHVPFRPVWRFLYMYVGRGGILDGRAGFRYCRLLAWYERLARSKLRELKRAASVRV